MFIAMNRFTVKREQEQAFVEMWKTRDSFLDEVPGFKSFYLLRGPEMEESIIYATHTMWVDESDFHNWVKSEAFKKAHQSQRLRPEMFAAPTKLEMFNSV